MNEEVPWTLVLAIVGLLATSGCIAEDAAEQVLERTGATEDVDGWMSVNETEEREQDVRETVPPFYDARTVRIDGEVTLASLPVTLSTVDGNVDVTVDSGNEYEVEIELVGYGFTPEEAESQRERLDLEKSTGEPGNRELVVHVDEEDDEGEDLRGRAEGHITLVLPSSLTADMTASGVNGDVSIDDLLAGSLTTSTTNGETILAEVEVDHLQASSTNGPITADVEGTRNVVLSTTNAAIDAEIHPGASGSITSSSTNGDQTLAIPEDEEFGYEARASSTNGCAEIDLEDGETWVEENIICPSEATFTTQGFDQREIRTDLTATSTNGNVLVEPS